MMSTGMAYCLWWGPLVRHHQYWIAPGDMWNTFRAAHLVGWGALSYIYSGVTGQVTLPGYPILLAPVAMLSGALGLSESVPPLHVVLPHASAWLLLGPISMLLGCCIFFAIDDLAQGLGSAPWRRRLLGLAAGIVIWPAVVIWGHPEDVIAVALAIWALVALDQGRYVKSGWLIGGALALQLLVVAIVPIYAAALGRRRMVPFLARGALLPVVLTLAVVIPDFHTATYFLLKQPNWVSLNHATPWVHFAPRLGEGIVAAGPSRIAGFAISIGIAVWVARQRPGLERLVWAAGVALAARCVFESVMDAYYVMPALLFFVAAAVVSRSIWRMSTTVVLAASLVAVLESQLGMWPWWGTMTILLAGAGATAFPYERRARWRRGSDARIPEPKAVDVVLQNA